MKQSKTYAPAQKKSAKASIQKSKIVKEMEEAEQDNMHMQKELGSLQQVEQVQKVENGIKQNQEEEVKKKDVPETKCEKEEQSKELQKNQNEVTNQLQPKTTENYILLKEAKSGLVENANIKSKAPLKKKAPDKSEVSRKRQVVIPQKEEKPQNTSKLSVKTAKNEFQDIPQAAQKSESIKDSHLSKLQSEKATQLQSTKVDSEKTNVVQQYSIPNKSQVQQQPTGSSLQTGYQLLESTYVQQPLQQSEQQQKYIPSQSYHDLLKQIESQGIQIIPLNKIQVQGDLLGEGGFGAVYKGKWSNQDVAIKEMRISYEEYKIIQREMQIMCKYRHQRIVSMYGIAVEEVRPNRLNCYIVMELMNKDLDDYIFVQGSAQKPVKEKVKICRQIAEGLQYLHDSEVVHRDIKPQNILLNSQMDAKLTDLGIAKIMHNKEKTSNATMIYTAKYVSKETAIDEIISFASDIWSLGMVFYELFTQKRVWKDCNSNKIILQLSKEQSPFQNDWENIINNQDLVKLILSCTSYDVTKRPKANQIVSELQNIEKKL